MSTGFPHISKTALKCGGSCTTATYYWVTKRELAKEPENKYMLDNGTRVGIFARGLFPEAELVAEENPFEQAAKTRNLLDYYKRAEEEAVICEAGFKYWDLYCAVDILRVKANGHLDVMEVKASKESEKIKDSYYRDVAIQLYIIEQCGYTVDTVSLVLINSNFVKHGDIDPKEFFVTIDVTEHARNLQTQIDEEVHTIRDIFTGDKQPCIRISDKCFSPQSETCPFWESVCKQTLPENSIFDFKGGIQATTKSKLYNEKGVVTMADYLKLGKTHTLCYQQAKVEVEKDDRLKVEHEALREFLAKIDRSKPIISIDFETLGEAIPLFDGQKAYDITVFQVSVDVLNCEGEAIQHYEYLAKPGNDWRVEFAHELVKFCPSDGTVIVWNDTMEGNRINELMELPGNEDIKDALKSIFDRIVDLMEVFRKRMVYQRAMKGSYSLKHVLPALFPNNKRLSYDELSINNGSKAQEEFARLLFDKDLTDLDIQAIRQGLFTYCGRDTLVPMYILEFLFKLINPNYGELFKKTERLDQTQRNILVGDKVATDRGSGVVTGFTRCFVRVQDDVAKYLRKPSNIYDLSAIDHTYLHHSTGSFAPLEQDETGVYKNCFVDVGGNAGRVGEIVVAAGKLGEVVGRTKKYLKIKLPNGDIIHRTEKNVTLVK